MIAAKIIDGVACCGREGCLNPDKTPTRFGHIERTDRPALRLSLPRWHLNRTKGVWARRPKRQTTTTTVTSSTIDPRLRYAFDVAGRPWNLASLPATIRCWRCATEQDVNA